MFTVTRKGDGRAIQVKKSDVFGVRQHNRNFKHTIIVYKNANYVVVREDIDTVIKRMGRKR